MPLISDVDAVRVILDLIQDRDVTTPANYTGANVDKMQAAKTAKYCTAMANERGLKVYDTATPPALRAPTNEELAAFMIKSLKEYIIGAHENQRVMGDEAAARIAARAAVAAETVADLGTP